MYLLHFSGLFLNSIRAHSLKIIVYLCLLCAKHQLFDMLSLQACSDKVMGSEVLIRLAKIQHVLWPRLTELKQKPAFVGVDFDRWNDSSSEVEGMVILCVKFKSQVGRVNVVVHVNLYLPSPSDV